ncbi:hypothetical protein JYU34_020568 [Plutella xylostella]|uniref:Uncharacterized protein n=1 Tax=Plutella xylostella TaxID=51655 RepID=A0ABQ7PUN6_PLUXY|nr:hypothetical protein JYU34_020568 [Plutella xylostella]
MRRSLLVLSKESRRECENRHQPAAQHHPPGGPLGSISGNLNIRIKLAAILWLHRS